MSFVDVSIIQITCCEELAKVKAKTTLSSFYAITPNSGRPEVFPIKAWRFRGKSVILHYLILV